MVGALPVAIFSALICHCSLRADIAPRYFFQIRAHKLLSSSLIAASYFVAKLFGAVTAEIQRLQNTNETLPRQWHEHLLRTGTESLTQAYNNGGDL